MANPGPLWKCECSECNCEEAAIKDDMEIDAICGPCGRGIHRAEREYKASIETRKRIAAEEKELKDRDDRLTIDIKGVKPDTMIGVLFSGVTGGAGPTPEKDELISKLFTMKIVTGCCGKEYTYNFTTFPREDLKCDCGKKGCWVVKFE